MNELEALITGENNPCCDVELPPLSKGICNNTTPSILSQLAQKKVRLEAEMKTLDDAIEALGKNPEVSDTLTKIGRAMKLRY